MLPILLPKLEIKKMRLSLDSIWLRVYDFIFNEMFIDNGFVEGEVCGTLAEVHGNRTHPRRF